MNRNRSQWNLLQQHLASDYNTAGILWWTDSNLPVSVLFTGEKSLIVHKHCCLTAATLTALIPFLSCYLSSVSRSLSLIGEVETKTLFYEMQNLRAMTYHGREKHVCTWLCIFGSPQWDKLFVSSCNTCTLFFSTTHADTHIHGSGKADSFNRGRWRCCIDWKSWVSTVCGMRRFKLWRCTWNCMCVWARYAVYSMCIGYI